MLRLQLWLFIFNEAADVADEATAGVSADETASVATQIRMDVSA